MKKIMIAAAIVCAAAMVNAASVSWKSGTIYVAVDAAGTTGSATSAKANTSGRLVKAYFYEIVGVGEQTAAQVYADLQTKSVSTLYADYITAGVTPTVAAKNSGGTGLADVSQTGVTDSSGVHYGMVIYEDKVNAATFGKTAFAKVAFATVDVTGSSSYSTSSMIPSGNWTAVPEPTSGLLLLVGGALLGLRRRRA